MSSGDVFIIAPDLVIAEHSPGIVASQLLIVNGIFCVLPPQQQQPGTKLPVSINRLSNWARPWLRRGEARPNISLIKKRGVF